MNAQLHSIMKTHVEEKAGQEQGQSEVGLAMAPPPFQLVSSPIDPPADPGGDAPIQRVLGEEEMEVFTEFGHSHRNPDLNPDEVGEDDGGIHHIDSVEEGARPEDAPVVNEFRVSFHKLHSAKLLLEQDFPDIYATLEEDHGFDVAKELSDMAADVKTASKNYKKKVKDMATDTSIADLKEEYRGILLGFGDRAMARAEELRRIISDQSGEELEMDAMHSAGTEIWRDKWHRIIMAVNTVLHKRWPFWKSRLETWTEQKRVELGQDYLDPAGILGLDYIGSLAKGYKGPPKQAVRFMPERFDVDANLSAPPLAAYAIMEEGAMVDRGRIWSKDAGIQVIIDMEEDIQAHLVDAGLEEMGMARDEPFEAVIDTTNLDSLPDDVGADGALAVGRIAEFTQKIRDLIFWQRHEDMDTFTRMAIDLEAAGLAVRDEDGHVTLKDNDEEAGEYAYDQKDILRFISILRGYGLDPLEAT